MYTHQFNNLCVRLSSSLFVCHCVCLCPSPALESLLSHSILSPFSLQDGRICRLHFHINPDKIDGGKAETAKRCAINLWITPLIIIAGNGLNPSKSTHDFMQDLHYLQSFKYKWYTSLIFARWSRWNFKSFNPTKSCKSCWFWRI